MLEVHNGWKHRFFSAKSFKKLIQDYFRDKVDISSKSKSDNTNKATKLWTKCFSNYLLQKNLPDIEKNSNQDLPSVLENFYGEVCKKNTDEFQVDGDKNSSNKLRYKNTTLKSIHSALVQYFKQTRSIDIIKNENFYLCKWSVKWRHSADKQIRRFWRNQVNTINEWQWSQNSHGLLSPKHAETAQCKASSGNLPVLCAILHISSWLVGRT